MQRPGARHLALLCLLSLTACGDDPVDPTAVVSIEVDMPAALNLPGRTAQAAARGLNARGEEVPGLSFSWQSSDPEIIAIEGGGLATATGIGQAEITASADGVTGSRAVRVTGVETLGFLSGQWTVTVTAPGQSYVADGEFTDLGFATEGSLRRDGIEQHRILTNVEDGRVWVYGRADGARGRMQVFRGEIDSQENLIVGNTGGGGARVLIDRVTVNSFRLRLQTPEDEEWMDGWTEEYVR